MDINKRHTVLFFFLKKTSESFTEQRIKTRGMCQDWDLMGRNKNFHARRIKQICSLQDKDHVHAGLCDLFTSILHSSLISARSVSCWFKLDY